MDNNDKEKRIIALIIIIIILLLSGGVGIFISSNIMIVQIPQQSYEHVRTKNSGFSKLKTIVSMPFFYIFQYPKMIIGISNGDFYYEDDESGNCQHLEKQFINTKKRHP